MSKLFTYDHRTGVDDYGYYQLVSPSGIRLNLCNCDKDTKDFIEEANAAILESERLRNLIKGGAA